MEDWKSSSNIHHYFVSDSLDHKLFISQVVILTSILTLFLWKAYFFPNKNTKRLGYTVSYTF